MRTLRAWLVRFGGLFDKRRSEREIGDEIESNLQLHIDDGLRDGMDPQEARRQALIRLGGIEPAKEAWRDRRGIPFLESLWKDVVYAFRTMGRSKGWTAVAILSLALGIGANTVVFSIIESVLLRPYPYPNSDELVLAWGSRNIEGGQRLSAPDVADWKDQSSAFEGLALYSPTRTMTVGIDLPVAVSSVAPDLFNVLGVRPMLGQGFAPYDEETRNLGTASTDAGLVVLSYGFWRSHFGGDTGIIGQTINLNLGQTIDPNSNREIVGVMPRGFFFPEHDVDIWQPLQTSSTLRSMRIYKGFSVVGRLRSGIDIDIAQAEIDLIDQRLDDAYPRSPGESRVTGLFPIHEVGVANYRLLLWLLLGAVGLVLLIACANLANLLLARNIARQKEFALRKALGSGRFAILRQLTCEGLVLSGAASLVALIFAYGGLRVVLGLGSVEIPRIQIASINVRVLLFVAFLSLMTGLVASFLPALKTLRVDRMSMLTQGWQASSPSGTRTLQDTLVVFEIALTLIVLVGTGLIVRSSVELSRIDWGFERGNLSVVSATQRQSLFDTPSRQRVEFAETITERLRLLPGVQAASAASVAPLVNGNALAIQSRVVANGMPVGSAVTASRVLATRDYMRALGVPITGREFDEYDDARAPRVAILNEALARELFPTVDPVGQIVHFAMPKAPMGMSLAEIGVGGPEDINDYEVTGETAHRVIGVAGNVRMTSDPSAGSEVPMVYRDFRQVSADGSQVDAPAGMYGLMMDMSIAPGTFLIRSEGDEQRLIEAAKAIMLDLNPEVDFIEAASMDTLISRALLGDGSNKLVLVLWTAFGMLSLLLSATGVYGVTSYVVNQKRFEIGVRLAVGAQPRNVLAMFLKHGLRHTAWGISLGLVGVWASSRLLGSMLFEITTTDSLTLLAVSLFLIFVTGVATFVPARRAASIDPLIATRSE